MMPRDPANTALYVAHTRGTYVSSDAVDYLQEALASAADQGAHFYTAEIHRLSGDIALELGRDQTVALASYRESISVANMQGALAFELRAVACLVELLVRIGDRNEAVRVATDLQQRLPKELISADVLRVREVAASEMH